MFLIGLPIQDLDHGPLGSNFNYDFLAFGHAGNGIQDEVTFNINTGLGD